MTYCNYHKINIYKVDQMTRERSLICSTRHARTCREAITFHSLMSGSNPDELTAAFARDDRRAGFLMPSPFLIKIVAS